MASNLNKGDFVIANLSSHSIEDGHLYLVAGRDFYATCDCVIILEDIPNVRYAEWVFTRIDPTPLEKAVYGIS